VLEVLVAAITILLVGAGLAVIAGPLLPRALRLAWRQLRPAGRQRRSRPRPEVADVNPTTQRAMVAAARLVGLLKANGLERQAGALRFAGRKLRENEVAGLQAMQEVIRLLRQVELEDVDQRRRFGDAVSQLRRAVADRAEQLEVLLR